MVNYREYKRHDCKYPPCQNCGNDTQCELSLHHVFPQEYGWPNHLRDMAISLCKNGDGNRCHKKLHEKIDRLEKQHGGRLPQEQYPLIALDFIT